MCVALSVDVDRFSDAKLKRDFCTPGCGILLNGKTPTVLELRVACERLRAEGKAVFPPCGNTRPDGYCAGHTDPDPVFT